MLLENKVAVIYGAAGAIGSAIARVFATEGARVFVTGRNLAAVQGLARNIGKSAQAAELDALDEEAIDKHLESVISK
ncbi:MAG: SDR family NAD(P)-dependent oxidoreductase, partial [Solirubrobacteraceae bacterium]